MSGSESNGPDASPRLRVPLVTGVILLVLRGLLLWLVVPITVVWWIGGFSYWRRKDATLGHVLGWADLNLIAALQRGPLRPLVTDPLRWTPLKDLPQVTHRLRVTDPV